MPQAAENIKKKIKCTKLPGLGLFPSIAKAALQLCPLAPVSSVSHGVTSHHLWDDVIIQVKAGIG